MSRPRLHSDDILLDLALEVIVRIGPDALTLADVAGASGLSPSTLVQRFGTKAELLRRALVRSWDRLDAQTELLISEAPQTPDGAVALLAALSQSEGEGDPAQNLLLLREDMRREELRARAVRWSEALSSALASCLADSKGPRPDLGRMMMMYWQGLVLWSGLHATAVDITADLTAFCAALRSADAA